MSVEVQERNLPAGTITFLFTDIQGSTELLKQLGEAYATLLTDQREILRTFFEKYDGSEIDTQGDAFFASFPRATQAVAAVVEIQRELANHDWPSGVDVRVRMGLHTGEPWLVEEGYVGMDVHRAARIAHVGHGGQVLLSQTTAPLVQDELPEGVELLDLGRHRLKDLRRPEHLHQLVIDGLPSEFPPLNSLEIVSSPGELEAQATARPPREVGHSPYRGLAAFQEEDAHFFFGRDAFTAQLAEAVQQHSLVAVVVGSSGSGKSSVVFAGLLPQMRGDDGWLVISIRPGEAPFHALASALLPFLEPGLDETDHLATSHKLADGLRTGEIPLFHTINRLLRNQDVSIRLLLFLDQFEELYTLCPDPDTRQAFTDELLAAVQTGANRRPNPISILLTLRADFMGQALTNRPFADAMQEGSLLLGPMNRTELQMAIERPAELQGAAFEPGLVNRILDDVGEEPGNLPLLEFALTLLWDQMDRGWMTHEVYHQIGRVEGALACYADQVYSGLTPQEQQGARRAFVQLVQPGQGTEDTRRVARRADLVGVDWGLIQHLADQRLVVTGLDEAGNETVEVVHEALIRGWGQLREWMAADRDFRNWQEGLRVALRGWESSGRDEGALLRGVPLAQAEEWLEARRYQIGDAERAYIQASLDNQQEQQTQRERRRRLIIGGLAAGLVIALFLSVFAFSQRSAAEQNAQRANQNAATAEAESLARATQQAIAEEQATLATARELAAAAMANLGTDPERSILLALESLAKVHTREAEEVLHRGILASRIEFTLEGDGSQLNDVTYSPDGTRLAAASSQGTVFIWDAVTGEHLSTLDEHSDWVNQIEFSPDGRLLATASFDGTARIWDVETGEPIHILTGHRDNTNLQTPETNPVVSDVAFSPKGEFLATSSNDGTVKIWNLENGDEIQTIDYDGRIPFDLAFSPDEDILGLVGENGMVRIVDPASGEDVVTLAGHEAGSVSPIIFSPDGKVVLTSGEDGSVRVWDTVSGEQRADFPIDERATDASPDNTQFATAGINGLASIWDLETGREILSLAGHTDRVWTAAFNPNGDHLATASGDGTVKIWDLKPSREAQTLLPNGDSLSLSMVPSIAVSRDQTTLAAGSVRGSISLWDLESGEQLGVLTGHEDFVGGLAFSPDGSRLYSSSDDQTVKIWDITMLKTLQTLHGHDDWVNNLALSPDGTILATVSSDETVRVWDASNGDELVQLPLKGESWGIAFSPDGDRLATSDIAGEVTIWDTATLQPLLVLEHLPYAYKLAFSPDGSQLVSSSLDGTLKFWDVETGKEFRTVKAHQSLIWGVAFSPDGSKLATAAGDNTVRLWDAVSGENLLTLEGHSDALVDVLFNLDGTRLFTSSWDGTVRVWVLPLDELIELARSRLTRSLTTEECQTYLHLEACPKTP